MPNKLGTSFLIIFLKIFFSRNSPDIERFSCTVYNHDFWNLNVNRISPSFLPLPIFGFKYMPLVKQDIRWVQFQGDHLGRKRSKRKFYKDVSKIEISLQKEK